MANSTFSALKIKCLQRAGNSYNSADATRLSIAGGIINDVLAMIGQQIKGHPYTLDIGNSIATTASQAYVDLVDTDIIELVQFTQRSTSSKLKQITYQEYVTMFPNTTLIGGVPELVFAPTTVIAAGVLTYRVYLGWTPSSAVTMYYDYIKSMRFTADGTSADAEYSPLPTSYDRWIVAEFAPIWYGLVSPEAIQRIQKAEAYALQVRTECLNDLKNAATHQIQMGDYSDRGPAIYRPVAQTNQP